MKTKEKMKTGSKIKSLLATGLLACAFTTNVHAATPDDLISAQVNLARDMTQKLIRDLTDGGADGIGDSADFQAKAKDFAEKVDTAMKQFESAVKGKIFAEIALQVRQYNAIYRSDAYSPEQKTALLNQLFSQMTSSMKYSGEALDSEIIQLMEVTGLPISNPDVLFSKAKVTWLPLNMGTVTSLSLEGCNFRTNTCKITTEFMNRKSTSNALFEDLLIDNIPILDFLSKFLITSQFSLQYRLERATNWNRFSVMKDGCASSSCVTLSAVMVSKYLQLIQTNFSGKSMIQLTDGKSFEVIPSSASFLIDTTLKSLFTYSPPTYEMSRLPFSVNEREWNEYNRQQQEQRRQQQERDRQQRLQTLLSRIPKNLSEMNSCNDIIDALISDLREIRGNQKTPLTDDQYKTILEKSGDQSGFLGLGGHKQKKCLDQAIIQAN